MKILHICTSGEYTDGFSYQDNLIAKYMKKDGLDVYVIASPCAYDEDGNTVFLPAPQRYVNECGVKVTRLPFRKPFKVRRKLRSMKGFYEELEKISPDVVFFHNPQTSDTAVLMKYLKKNPQVELYADSHIDFSNSATNWLSKHILHDIIWRHYVLKLKDRAIRFYGVLPARVEFLQNVYHVPAEKTELLVMGGDDELVTAAENSGARKKIREKYGIAPDDFLVMTGGKIDAFKTETLLLMQAVAEIKNEKLKLIVFGSVAPELKKRVNDLCDGKKIQYIGWVHAKDSYEYFAAADLVVFPGRHSVFWEQVTAQGVPMLCKKWHGTTHVDLDGNVKFLTRDSAEEIKEEIERLLADPELYKEMKTVAEEKGKKVFSYADISRRAIRDITAKKAK